MGFNRVGFYWKTWIWPELIKKKKKKKKPKNPTKKPRNPSLSPKSRLHQSRSPSALSLIGLFFSFLLAFSISFSSISTSLRASARCAAASAKGKHVCRSELRRACEAASLVTHLRVSPRQLHSLHLARITRSLDPWVLAINGVASFTAWIWFCEVNMAWVKP